MDAIIAAVASCVLSLCGVIITNAQSNKKIEHQL